MPSAESTSRRSLFTRRFAAAGYLIGIGMGGFFDGILLHQVLQWHHLLSLVDNPVLQDMRAQILADGLFHALMYVVSAVGLVCLWQSKNEFAAPGAAKWLFGTMLLGFGSWHVADTFLSHWIFQIHRIRVDSPNPLFWDLLWLAVFGLGFLFAGWWLRSQSSGGKGRRLNGSATVVAVSCVVTSAAAIAALPPSDSTVTMVLFRSDAKPFEVFHAFDAARARIMWSDRTGTLWAVKVEDRYDAAALYRHGAILVTNSAIGAGCVSWLRTRAAL